MIDSSRTFSGVGRVRSKPVSLALVLWFTGLSGSGKTTIANRLCIALEKHHKKVLVLDGDAIRSTVHRHLRFTPEDIKRNNEQIARLCVKHQTEYDVIIVPIISPFIESRQKARQIIRNGFVEVYVKASLETVAERDVKGLYKRAIAGEISDFIGVDPSVPYEAPHTPDIILKTENEDIPGVTKRLLEYVIEVLSTDSSRQ